MKRWALRLDEEASIEQLRRPEKGLLDESAVVVFALLHGNTIVLTG